MHATGVPTNNSGVTFYLFFADHRDTIPFFSSQKQTSSNLEAYSDNNSQIVFFFQFSRLKVLPLARKRSLPETDDNLILCHFAHFLSKTENLGQNFLRHVKLPLRRQLEILTILIKYLKFTLRNWKNLK